MFVIISKLIEDFIDYERKNIYDILKKKGVSLWLSVSEKK